MTSTRTIAITGATGHIGGAVARLLAADLAADRPGGSSLRLLVRDASRAPDLAGAEVRAVSYGDAAAVEALRGVDTLLMVSAAESDDRVGEHLAFVAHAAEAGVGHVVYTSFLGASADCTFLLGRDHHATEEAIRATGMGFTFLRDSFYADLFPMLADEGGVIRGPAGRGRLAPVARTDVAAAAARVLRDPDTHRGLTYDLTGPAAMDLDEAARRLSDALGRTITYHDETMEEARESRSGYGAPDWMVDAWISTYTAIAAGELDVVSDDLPRLLGRPATSLEQALAGATGS